MTLPLLAPAVVVLTPTPIAAALLPPAIRFDTLPPLFVAVPVAPLKLAFSASLKAPAAAVLATVSAWLALPPTRWLAMTTGVGVLLPTAALKALPVMLTVWPATLSKLFTIASVWPDRA